MSITKIDTLRHMKVEMPEGAVRSLALFDNLLLCATDKGVFAYAEKGWTQIKPGDPSKPAKQAAAAKGKKGDKPAESDEPEKVDENTADAAES